MGTKLAKMRWRLRTYWAGQCFSANRRHSLSHGQRLEEVAHNGAGRQELPGFGVTVFEHLQAADVVLVHHHVAHGKRAQVLHRTAAGTLHHVDELPTQL
jgi:hypothetical protein